MMAWFAKLVIPLDPGAWRWVFVVGAGGAIVAFAATWLLPESVRWQEANRRGARALALVEKLESQARSVNGRDLPEPINEPVQPPLKTVDLFGRPLAKRTVVASLMTIFLAIGFYGFNSWVPTLLVDRGLTTAQSLSYAAVLSLAAVPGALLAWPIIDRIERRYSLLLVGIVVAVGMVVFGFATRDSVLLAVGMVVTLFLSAATTFTYTYLPEIFPMRLRATGTGFVNGMGRIAAFGGSFLIAAVYSGLGYSAVFLLTGGALLLMGLVVGLFGERTTNRNLEDIGERDGK